MTETATVCLFQYGHHENGVLIFQGKEVPIVCGPLDPRAIDTHADLQDATENGAVGIAITLVRSVTSYEIVERSVKGTGFDWYLRQANSTEPFENSACLEVSGILKEDSTLMERRTKEKLKQVETGGKGLPGFVVVVGFKRPQAVVESFS